MADGMIKIQGGKGKKEGRSILSNKSKTGKANVAIDALGILSEAVFDIQSVLDQENH